MCINQTDIKGFGDLAKYDAAITFGCIIGKFPDKIFMHAGPEKAARFIFGNKYAESLRYLKQSGKILPYIDVKEFSQEFNALKTTPYLIEDCLCYIYSSTYLKAKVK